MFSLCLSVCFSVNMVESDTGWWNQGHFLQCEKHQFPFFHWGRERELGEGASPHICTLCHTGKCCNCLCPSDCLQTCRCISWISLKIFFSFHWCAIMCYEGFFFFFFSKVQGCRPTSMKILSLPHCKLQLLFLQQLLVLCSLRRASPWLFFADLLLFCSFIFLPTSVIQAEPASRPWNEPTPSWGEGELTGIRHRSVLWIKPTCLGIISHCCSHFTQLGRGCRTGWSNSSNEAFLQLEP